MSANWIVVGLVPLSFILVVVVECGRLHGARLVQRRMGVTRPLSSRDSADFDTSA